MGLGRCIREVGVATSIAVVPMLRSSKEEPHVALFSRLKEISRHEVHRALLFTVVVNTCELLLPKCASLYALCSLSVIVALFHTSLSCSEDQKQRGDRSCVCI